MLNYYINPFKFDDSSLTLGNPLLKEQMQS